MYNALLVDDEILALEGLSAMVDWEGRGFARPILATSMKQAIAAIQSARVDVVVCDIEMPNGTGLELLSWINANGLELITIFLTFHARFDFVKEAMGLGAFDYLLKPASADELNATITHCLKRLDDMSILAREREKRLSGPPALAAGLPEASLAKKVMDYIDQNLGRELTRKELCGVAYVHQDYLSTLFRRETGKTVSAYIFERRMAMATALLRDTDDPIGEISERVGYSFQSHFSKMFKMKTGLSPQQYRARSRDRR